MNIDFALVKEQTFFHLYMMLEQKRIFKPQNSKAPCNEKEIFKYFSYIFFFEETLKIGPFILVKSLRRSGTNRVKSLLLKEACNKSR